MMHKKTVVLFFDRTYIEAHFCFKELAIQLARKNYRVHLFYLKNEIIPDFSKQRNINLYAFSRSKKSLIIVLLKLLFLNFNVLVSTPQWALYWASKLKKLKSFKLIYLSDEVYAKNEKDYSIAQKIQPLHMQQKWKEREIIAHHLCDATIALGKERYDLLKQINRLPGSHPHFIIPNAPSSNIVDINNNGYYKEKFLLKSTDSIILHSGGLGWELIHHINNLQFPENIKIILQTRKKFPDFVANSPNVIVNEDFIPYENIVSVTSSAHIGLLLYDESNPEEKRNGNTAGKLGLYLAAGIPIIAGNLKSFKWIEEKGIGVRINNVNELVEAAGKIMKNYSEYQENAMKIYNEEYEYSRKFQKFANWLNQ